MFRACAGADCLATATRDGRRKSDLCNALGRFDVDAKSGVIDRPFRTFHGAKALVLGLGVHGGGVGVARYLAEQGAIVHVTDLQSADRLQLSLDALSGYDLTYTLGRHDPSDLDGVDFVVRNPGVPPETSFVQLAIGRGIPIYMEMTLFFLACPAKRIIGITGTKGKTTTTTLTGEMIRQAGRDTVVAGNLRISALEQLHRIGPETEVVLELSSFQLEGLDVVRRSPSLAAVTNLMVDHLNRYASMDAYIQAKKRIFTYQLPENVTVLNGMNDQTRALAIESPGHVVFFESDTTVPGFGQGSCVWEGAHNLANAQCATTIARQIGISDASIEQAVRSFAGVPYRQEIVRIHRGVRYINDTAATTPDATAVALAAIRGPIVLIAGGADKGLDFGALARSLASAGDHVSDIVLLEGSATDRLVEAIGVGRIRGRYRNFGEAVQRAADLAVDQGAVLLSPGCASFGMFVNEFDRGDQFNELVRRFP